MKLPRAQVSWLVPAFCALWLAASLAPERPRGGFDLAEVGRLGVLHEGRVKPLDTVARSALLMLRGKQTFHDGTRRESALEWLLDVMARPARADAQAVFVVDDPDVLGMLDLEPQGRYYSYAQLRPGEGLVAAQAERVEPVEPGRRSRFQSAVLALDQRLRLYRGLQNTLLPAGTEDFPRELAAWSRDLSAARGVMAAHRSGRDLGRRAMEPIARRFGTFQLLEQSAVFRPLPPEPGEGAGAWKSFGEALLGSFETGRLPEGVPAYAELLQAWRARDAGAFAGALKVLPRASSEASLGAGREAAFNRWEPFYKGMVLYVLALLLACASWLLWHEELRRAAWWTLLLALGVHTAGLLFRVLIQGRPPVTNLYSSAVFVGWGAAAAGAVLERLHRRGAAAAVSAAIGFVTLLVAHHLAAGGDTMEAMRAVLDSNFWLATHVVTITIGYSGNYLAGLLAHVFILRGLLDRSFGDEDARALARMTYGTICFSLFFTFLGTVLGGIWADQSWGRFWGWDPKENGALLLVLWGAFILHARSAGTVRARTLGTLSIPQSAARAEYGLRARGMMVCAVLGVVLTSFSWFGVNMLGVGLHSYGFMERAFLWLAGFSALEFAVAAAGLLPSGSWRSRSAFHQEA
ncbi:MAG: cytochrome c biogenesis protein CcsA [Elusimicrobiota bacterium]|jgi:ABC-type transport system involved in cytochrome c biogenesis permease subunit